MQIDNDGWLDEAAKILSPNADTRPPDTRIELLVIHAISLPPGEFGGDYIAAMFQNRLASGDHPYFESIQGLHVSAHFLIDRNGALTQFVSCHQRAWHAGISCWRERERCNDFSLGIELEGSDDTAFTDAQYASLNRLATLLYTRYPISETLGHSDIAPGRKTDPGPLFDWSRVAMPKH